MFLPAIAGAPVRIEIQPPDFLALRHVAVHMREQDRRELAVTRDPGDWASLIGAASFGQAWAELASIDGEPTFAYGATIAGRDAVQVWAFGTTQAKHVLRAVTRRIQRVMIPRLLELGVKEARAVSHPAHVEAHRWLQYLGFKPEAKISGVGVRGEDMFLFVARAHDFHQPR